MDNLDTYSTSLDSTTNAVTPIIRARILLVDDNDSTLKLVGDFLRHRGHQVETAQNGRTAIAAAQRWQPDIILMDIQMPDMDGLEAIQRLRALPDFATRPIFAVTALAMDGDRERCMDAGATDYVSKPMRLRELASMIQIQMENKNASHQ